MAKIIRLTESDLTRIVKRVIKESKYLKNRDYDRWIDNKDILYADEDLAQFDTDFDEEEFDDYEAFVEKHPEMIVPFDWRRDGDGGRKMFNRYKNDYGPLKVRTYKKMDEQEEEDVEEWSDERIKKMVDFFWDSMTTGEKRRFMAKIDKEREEKGLPSLRPKTSRITKKNK